MLVIAGCKNKEVYFTRIPVLGVVDREARPNETSVHLAVPVDLGGMLAVAEQVVGEQVMRARDYMDDIACDRRKTQWLECNGAVVTTELNRAGPIEFSVEGHALQLRIPLRYSISAKGQGWAAYLTDGKSGTVTASVPFELTLGAGYRLDARMGSEITWSERSVPILKGKLAFARVADSKLKGQLRAAAEPLRQAVAGQPVREATEAAWRALHQPIALSRAKDLWLRGLPERLAGGGFGLEDGALVYRIRIDARVGVHRGERPQPLFEKPLPEPQRSQPRGVIIAAGKASGPAILRLPIEIPIGDLKAAVAAVFPKQDVIETRADMKTAPVKVRVVGVDLLPARDRLALGLQLDVVEPVRLFGLTGRAYLVGRPVLDAATGVLELQDIIFPPAVSREGASGEGLRIGEEPFAGRFAVAARMNVGSVVQDLLPRVNEAINQPLDDALLLRGQFETVEVLSVEPAENAVRIHVALTGDLSLRYGAAAKSTGSLQPTGASAGLPKPSLQ